MRTVSPKVNAPLSKIMHCQPLSSIDQDYTNICIPQCTYLSSGVIKTDSCTFPFLRWFGVSFSPDLLLALLCFLKELLRILEAGHAHLIHLFVFSWQRLPEQLERSETRQSLPSALQYKSPWHKRKMDWEGRGKQLSEAWALIYKWYPSQNVYLPGTSISLTFLPHFTFLLGNLCFFILLLFCNPYI